MKKNGFSLIELMIAVGIAAILAAIAIPSYSAYVKRANRTDATKSISVIAQALERCYTQNYTYVGCPAAVSPVASTQGYYTVTITLAPGPPSETYSINAVPALPPQTTDAQCTSFTVDSAGTQTTLPAGNVKTCWGST
ncbi:MAG TPA: type IV pilin protein [Steroidobacteraceae bacterium]